MWFTASCGASKTKRNKFKPRWANEYLRSRAAVALFVPPWAYTIEFRNSLDVWAAFFCIAPIGLRGNFCYQAIALIDPR
jgi:hypothetical protein